MDLTGTIHISNSYIPNSRSEPVFASGQRSATIDRTSSLRVPNVQGCNIEASSVAQRRPSVSIAGYFPASSDPRSNFNRCDSTDYLVPGSDSERLLHLSVSQPNISQCSSQNGLVNHSSSQHNSGSSSYSLPEFSPSCQPELRNLRVYSQSHMTRTENNPMSLHMPLPTANFSSVPHMSSSSYQQVPGYFPQYSSLRQPNSVYSAPIQQQVDSSIPFSHVAQGSIVCRHWGLICMDLAIIQLHRLASEELIFQFRDILLIHL